jgi:hypothetical protein
VLTPSIIITLMMEAETVSETLEYNAIPTRLIPEKSSLHSVAVKAQNFTYHLHLHSGLTNVIMFITSLTE